MTTPGRGCFSSLVLIVWAAALSVPALPQAGTHTIPLAGSPPMGWNSWDCYGTSVTEAQVKGNADYMSKNLALPRLAVHRGGYPMVRAKRARGRIQSRGASRDEQIRPPDTGGQPVSFVG